MAKTTIPAGYFAAGSIATADLADDAITSAKITDDAITSAKIADNAITAAMVPNATALTLDGGLTVDNITINGTEIDLSSGNLTVDVAGNLILAPGSDEVHLLGNDDTTFGKFYASSGNFYINMPTQDKDIIFSGNDGGSSISPMIIDMSAGGKVGIGTTTPTHGLTVSDEVLDDSSSRRITIKSTNHGANAGYRFQTESADGSTRAGGLYFKPENTADNSYISLSGNDSTSQLVVTAGGKVGIGTESPASQLTLSDAAPTIHLIDSDNNADAYIQGTDGNIKFYADDNGEASSSEITFALDGTQRAKIDADGDFTATNVYAGAAGLQTQIVNFPNTTTYPNNSTYTINLTAAQAPIGSRVLMGVWVSSGNSGGDQYGYLVQNQEHGPRLLLHVDDWYYSDGALSMYKIDNSDDRTFTFTHGTIVATNSNDFRRVYYYGYIMDN